MGDYDFILNPSNETPKKSGGLPGGGSQRTLILISIFGGILVVVLFAVFSIFGGQPDNKAQLLKVAQQQQELIRVSKIGVKESRSTQSRNLATTTQLSLTSDQAPLLQALRQQKVNISNRQLGESKNSETDKMLESAKNNNRFDEEFMSFIQEELVEYQKNLENVYKATVNKSLKEALKVQYENASILIGEDPET